MRPTWFLLVAALVSLMGYQAGRQASWFLVTPRRGSSSHQQKKHQQQHQKHATNHSAAAAVLDPSSSSSSLLPEPAWAPAWDTAWGTVSGLPGGAAAAAETHRVAASSHHGAKGPAAAAAAAPDITIISFTNHGMVDFALNWLHHLRLAVGPEAVSSSLLMYVVGDDTRRALVGSGLLPEHCIRDGTVRSQGFDKSHEKAGHSYESPGFKKLAAQRPRIILDALQERGGSSRAVLYSDVDAVWRSDPLPHLRGLLGRADVAGAQDTYLVCTGFFMFSTSNPQVPKLLEDWEQSVSAGDKVNQYAFNDKLKAYPQLKVHRLPHKLFPSGMEFFHKGLHASTALVVHANYFQGQDAKRNKLRGAGLWVDKPRPRRAAR